MFRRGNCLGGAAFERWMSALMLGRVFCLFKENAKVFLAGLAHPDPWFSVHRVMKGNAQGNGPDVIGVDNAIPGETLPRLFEIFSNMFHGSVKVGGSGLSSSNHFGHPF